MESVNIYMLCSYNELVEEVSRLLGEDLPNSEESIRNISKWVKNEGIALITEFFSAIVPKLSTYLKQNFKYADKTSFLFLRHNLLF